MKNKMKIGVAIGSLCILLFAGFVISYEKGNELTNEDTFYMVSHSEYWSGEEGQIIARLYNWQGDPIIVDNCTVDITYPDKSSFVSDALTDDSLQASTATHFYKFTTPAIEGVYQYMVTCTYNSKERAVSNSFHLSPALNLINVVNQSINDLTAQELQHYNDVQANISIINGDLFTIKNDLTDIKVNLTDISEDTSDIRSNMLTVTQFNTNITTVVDNQNTIINQGNDILNNLTAIENFCGDATTSGSQLCLWVDEIQTKVTSMNSTVSTYNDILSEINQTTHSTYDYMTGTLATNINGIINSLSRVETNTVQINQTVNQIQTNQEDIVYIEATS